MIDIQSSRDDIAPWSFVVWPDNHLIQMEGTYYDNVKFYNALLYKIGDDDIKDGNYINGPIPEGVGEFSDISVFVHAGILYASVRHGKNRDGATFYAIVNERVYRTPRWYDSAQNRIRLEWREYGANLSCVASGNSQCTFVFNVAAKAWSTTATGGRVENLLIPNELLPILP